MTHDYQQLYMSYINNGISLINGNRINKINNKTRKTTFIKTA